MGNNVVKGLLPVVFADMRVLTYKQVAEWLKYPVVNLKTLFSAHKEQFQQGVHFFNVEGSVLHALKMEVRNLYLDGDDEESSFALSFGYGAKCLKLWTCQGVARLSKLIDTPKAWELFTALENNYFNFAPVEEPPEPAWKNKFLNPAPVDTDQKTIDKLKEENSMLKNQLSPLTNLEFAVVYVLLMSNGSVKIGMTQNLTERIKQLKHEKGLDTFWVHSTPFMPREDAAKLEKALHDKFAPLRWRGEFYKARFVDVVAELKRQLV